MILHYWKSAQVQRLLDALADQGKAEARTAAEIMWRAGLRIGETLAIEWQDIDVPGGLLAVRPTKASPGRLIPLHDDLIEMSGTWWPRNGSMRRLFKMSRRTALRHIRAGIEAAGLDDESTGTGIQKAGAQSLRHSAAVHWLSSGIPVDVVSSWLGHSSLVTTILLYEPMLLGTYSMVDVP